MGNRGNVYFKQEEVFLYTHYSGTSLGTIVRDALARRARWEDGQYLTRIVFCAMVGNRWDGDTGYGITHRIQDSGAPVIVVDTESMTVSVVAGGYKRSGIDVTKTRDPVSFSRLVEMSDEEVRLWHLGPDTEE